MNKKLLFFMLFLPIFTIGQQDSKFGIKFHGFVKSDLLFDSRQTVDAREGHFLLYPVNESLDPDGKDINAKSSYNLLSIQTRLKGFITGPDIGNIKTSAYIEGEFFGMNNSDINGFRLRHAFLKLKWETASILVGQYWHPLFATKCYPGTVSFIIGAPFQPFSRNPQIRVTKSFGGFNLMLTALSQIDFVSNGPAGVTDRYQRNSTIPAFNFKVEYEVKNKSNGLGFLIGASANYKMLVPTLVTDSLYKSDATISSLGFAGYVKLATKAITLKAYGFYGGDAFNLVMLGGYAETGVKDPVKGIMEYSCVRNNSYWLDFSTNGKKLAWGLFGGYSKNLGSTEKIIGNEYVRGADIDFLYRVSTRLIWNVEKFRLAPEIEYTAAAYATKDSNGNLNRDDYGKITDSNTVSNFRILIGFFYFF
ncbi:MAG: hypothetical protein C0598_14415 [Marinilabiliales bacterium]|nr:MAG: hypothetical protein C0598_14415 [Marinilabiliales bacterium]